MNWEAWDKMENGEKRNKSKNRKIKKNEKKNGKEEKNENTNGKEEKDKEK